MPSSKPAPKSVAVLEWLAGGGLCPEGEPDNSLAPLLNEGRQMLQCLASGFAEQGATVYSAVDQRLVTSENSWPCDAFAHVEPVPYIEHAEQLIDIWIDVAKDCEVAIVVAPEIDQLLQNVLSEMRRRSSCELLNCSPPFLDLACDKWKFARHCQRSHISHPPTSLSPSFSHLDMRSSPASKLVCKSRFGAGCEDLYLAANSAALNSVAPSLRQSELAVIQEWIEGQAFSSSAIVNASNHWHWLPLVTQEFEHKEASGLQTLQYTGGRVTAAPPGAPQLQDLQLQLSDSFRNGARGWVSFDLVYSAERNQWFVIEANPRCTTSITELKQQVGSELFEHLLRT